MIKHTPTKEALPVIKPEVLLIADKNKLTGTAFILP